MPDELLDGTPDTRTWVGTLHHGPHTPDYGLTFISLFLLFFSMSGEYIYRDIESVGIHIKKTDSEI